MLPNVGADYFRHSKRPAAAVDVAPVLPHREEARLEQVYRLAHLDLLDGCVVIVAPKVLNGFDLGPELFELGIVFAIGRLVVFGLSNQRCTKAGYR